VVETAADVLEPIFITAAAELQAAHEAGDLTLMIGHVNVAGAITSTGQPNIGREIELNPRAPRSPRRHPEAPEPHPQAAGDRRRALRRVGLPDGLRRDRGEELQRRHGPWTVGDPTPCDHDYPKRYRSESVGIRAPGRACVATVFGGHEGGSLGRPYVSLESGRANARLIATAPELLDAARAVLRAADAFHDDTAYYIEVRRDEIEALRAVIAKAEVPA
jgi:hypothetical protein